MEPTLKFDAERIKKTLEQGLVDELLEMSKHWDFPQFRQALSMAFVYGNGYDKTSCALALAKINPEPDATDYAKYYYSFMNACRSNHDWENIHDWMMLCRECEDIAFWGLCAALRCEQEQTSERLLEFVDCAQQQSNLDELISALCESRSPLMVRKVMDQLSSDDRIELLVGISYFVHELELNTPEMLGAIEQIYARQEIDVAAEKVYESAHFGRLGTQKADTLDFFSTLKARQIAGMLTQELEHVEIDLARRSVPKI